MDMINDEKSHGMEELKGNKRMPVYAPGDVNSFRAQLFLYRSKLISAS